MKRGEIIYIYDIKDGNPNGDPLDSNKPRIDEETGINLVTDVRLKRTVRDYLNEYKNKEIFVKETPSEKGEGIKDGKARSKDFGSDKEKVLDECIDIRLFGGVLPLEKDSITFTGPVQFGMGRSMHRVEMQYIKGTGAFASSDGKKQATFREEYILPYSLISYHGLINENAAKGTRLTEEDVNLLIEGIIEGTKNLITRSKFGQMPRLLIKVNYSTPGFFIGDLNKYIVLNTNKRDEQIRDIEDVTLDLTNLKKILKKYEEKIDSVDYFVDDRVKLSVEEKVIEIEDVLEGKMKEIKY